MAKKVKKKLTIEEVRDISAKKSSPPTEDEELPENDRIYYEDVYDDENPDYIRQSQEEI